MALGKKMAFIGGGNMAEALVKGVLSAEVAGPDQVIVTDTSSSRLTFLQRRYNISVMPRNPEAVRQADVVLLCVKPQVMDAVLSEIAPVADPGKLVISIAAGVTIERIENALTGNPRVVRVMPNTPSLVLAGAAGIAGGKSATDADLTLAQEIFGAVGRAVVVDEKLLDAVTGLSGSGPAYVFTFIEALADAGVKVGLPRSLSLELAIQTVLGSARMAFETKEHPAKLRDMVTSPGGTTIAGMHELEKGRFHAAIMSAVEAATKRSRELGGKKAVSPKRTQRKKGAKKVSRRAIKSAKKKKKK